MEILSLYKHEISIYLLQELWFFCCFFLLYWIPLCQWIAVCLRVPRELGGTEYPCYAGDTRDLSSISGSGRSPRERNGNSLQYSCLGNPTGEVWATVRGVVIGQTWLSTHTHTHTEACLTSFLKQWFSPPQHLHHLGSFSDPHSVLHLSRDHPVSIHTEDPLGGYKLPSPGVPSCPLVSVAPSALSLPLPHTWQFHKSFGWNLACWYGNPFSSYVLPQVSSWSHHSEEAPAFTCISG